VRNEASLGRRCARKLSPQRSVVLEQKRSLCREFIKKAETEITLAPEEVRAREQINGSVCKAGLAVPSVRKFCATQNRDRASRKLLQICFAGKSTGARSAD